MLVFVLFIVIILLVILLFVFFKKASSLEKELQELSFQKSSQSVRYGKITEQFVPFIEELPFDSANFRFLGSPIDGVAFQPDKIVFCEFKAANSQLNARQKSIRDLVNTKKVEWIEFRIK